MHKSICLQRSTNHVFRQIQPSLWQIEFLWPVSTNCWLVQDEDGLTLIDAAHSWSSAHILSAIESVGQPLRRIITTHAHPDHTGAAAELSAKTGAEVFAHASDVPYLEGRTSMADERGFWGCRIILKTAQALGSLHAPPIQKVEAVSDGEMVGSLRVLHTPGHTPGSLSLWCERNKAIFTGDNIIYSLRALRFGAPWFTLDHRMQKESVRCYGDFAATMLLPGHGAIFSGNVAAAMKRHLRL